MAKNLISSGYDNAIGEVVHQYGDGSRLTASELAKMVVIEVMPAHLVASHRAARNFGVYPANGAERYVTTRDWAEEVTAGADYDHIVRDAKAGDLATYSELPESW